MKKAFKDVVEIEALEVAELGTVVKGLAVKHFMFGAGVVVAIFQFPDGENTIGIEFEKVGYKALVPKYAKLQLATSDNKSRSVFTWLKKWF
jgi:hypothetical protein